MIDATRLNRVEAVIAHDMIPDFIFAGKFADAIDAALRYCHAQKVLAPPQDTDQLEMSIYVGVSWSQCVGRGGDERAGLDFLALAFPRFPQPGEPKRLIVLSVDKVRLLLAIDFLPFVKPIGDDQTPALRESTAERWLFGDRFPAGSSGVRQKFACSKTPE